MIWILSLVLVLAALVLMLPIVVKTILNSALRKLDGYTGRIEQVKINLVAGRLIVKRLTIVDEDDPMDENSLIMVPEIAVSFTWKMLFRKTLELDIVVVEPQLLFTNGASSSAQQKNDAGKSPEVPVPRDFIEKLMAFRINLDVRQGKVCYINSGRQAPVKVTDVNVRIRDFSNRAELTKVCTIAGTCSLYDGYAQINAKLVPLAPSLTVDFNLEMTSINLVLLNDVLNRYAKVDVSKGTLNLFAEVAVVDQSFKGYLKPLLTDLDFISTADRDDNIFRKIWERVVAGVYNVIENQKDHQVATKIPIEGRLDDPHVHVGVAILGVLRNAFVKALTPSLENLISFKSIWGMTRAGAK